MTETRKLIQETFLELARTGMPKKITVTDIVNACQINRNSFYYYFEDLPDMIESTVVEMMEEAIHEKKPTQFRQLVAIMEKFMRENRNVCLYLYRTPAKNDLVHYYRRTGNQIVETYLDSVQYYGMDLTQEEKKHIIRFYKNILVGLLDDWMALNMKDDLVQTLVDTMDSGLKIIAYKRKQMKEQERH